MRYDDKSVVKSRTDEEDWSRFKRALDEKLATSRLQPKKIAVADDDVEFALSRLDVVSPLTSLLAIRR